MEEVHKKNKLTQWGSPILTSILTSHMMVTKNPQNVHRNNFWAILLTFIFDINICEPHYVNLCFFLWTSSIVCMFNFLIFDIFLTTWHLFDILTHQLNLNHLSPHRAIFIQIFTCDCWKIIFCVSISDIKKSDYVSISAIHLPIIYVSGLPVQSY